MRRKNAPPIEGTVADGFEPVREAFRNAFERDGELGASCAVVQHGELVVDLWGGFTDKSRKQPWKRDTLVLCYSLSKGISALASAHAVSHGLFQYEDKVAEHWPEFEAGGKAEITVRELLSEQAGLSVIERSLTPKELENPADLAGVLAGQEPSWAPGEWSGNHAWTVGWLHSELIRRKDPEGRTLGRYFREEIAEKLGADFYFGLPWKEVSGKRTVEEDYAKRMARIKGWCMLRLIRHLDTMPWMMVLCMTMPWTLTYKTLANPFVLNPSELDRKAWWPVENGGAGGIGNARAVARLYGEFATGGEKLGITQKVYEALRQDAEKPKNGWMDKVLKTNLQYSLGLEKPSSGFPFGSDQSAFGTFALGGSMGFADPRTGVGYGYTTNQLGFHLWNDPREMRVRKAVFEVIEAQQRRMDIDFSAVKPSSRRRTPWDIPKKGEKRSPYS